MNRAILVLLGVLIIAGVAVYLGLDRGEPENDAPAAVESEAPANDPKVTEPDPGEPEAVATNGDEPGALEIIHRRKSVRSYSGEPVSREDLETAVRAGMAAPTGGNRQPWVFMVFTDREKLETLGGMIRPGRMLADAAAGIMVGGVPDWGIPGEVNAYWVQDTSAATQNILLAIEAMDLGAVWIGVHPRESREKKVRDVLGLPDDVVPLNLIAVGHPTGEEEPKDKWQPHRVHWEEWSAEQFEME